MKIEPDLTGKKIEIRIIRANASVALSHEFLLKMLRLEKPSSEYRTE